MPVGQEKTFTLIFPDGKIVLNVNPERTQRASPSRMAVTQTLTGVNVDHFGAAFGSGSFSGTLGYGPPLASRGIGGGMDGLTQFKLLKQRFEQWQDRAAVAADPAQLTCEIVNTIDDEHLQVVFTQLSWSHAVGRLTLIDYTLEYRTLYDFSAPFRAAATPQLNGSGTIGSGETPPFPTKPGEDH